MNLVTALAIAIGLLSVLLTWLFLGPVLGGLGLSLWAAFIAWASFFNQGGGEAGLAEVIDGRDLGCRYGNGRVRRVAASVRQLGRSGGAIGRRSVGCGDGHGRPHTGALVHTCGGLRLRINSGIRADDG